MPPLTHPNRPKRARAEQTADPISLAVARETNRQDLSYGSEYSQTEAIESIYDHGIDEIDRAKRRNDIISSSFNRALMTDKELHIEALCNSPEIPERQRVFLELVLNEDFARAKRGELDETVVAGSKRVIAPADERSKIFSENTTEVTAGGKRLPSEVVQRLPLHELPSPSHPDESAAAAFMPAAARALFGDPPAAVSRPTKYTKSDFPIDWLDNQNIIRAARKVTNEYKARDKTKQITPEELERFRAANRLVRAYERRQTRTRTQSPPAGPSPR